MSEPRLSWERERPPLWDDRKRLILGGAPKGMFTALRMMPDKGLLPGEWWRVVRDGQTVGYGWMDVTWGDAEILLAVDADSQRSGVGTFILDRLAEEAAAQGVRYLYNVVPPQAPDPTTLSRWLVARGFAAAGDDGGLLRRQVTPRGAEAPA